MGDQRKSVPHKFAMDIIWVAASQILVFLTQWVIIITLTKSYTSNIFGIWSQMAVTETLLLNVLNLYLGASLIRFLAAENSVAIRCRVFSSMFWFILIFESIIFIFSLIFKQPLALLIFTQSEYVYLVPLTLLWSCLESLFSFLLCYIIARHKLREYAAFLLVSMLVKMLIIVIMAIPGRDLGWIITGLIACQSVIVLVLLGVIIRDIGWPRPVLGGLGIYLAFSLPQIPSVILPFATDTSNKYLITHLLDLSQTGIYAAAYAVSQLIAILYAPLIVVLFPTVTRLWEEKDIPSVKMHLEHSTKFFLTLAIPAVGGLFVLAQPLLNVFTTAQYIVGGEAVVLLSLAGVLYGFYQIAILTALLVKQTRWLPLIFLIAVSVVIGMDLALLPLIGITGAAISTVASSFILAVIAFIWSNKLIEYKLDFVLLAKIIAGTLLMVLCLSFIHIGGIPGILIIAAAGLIIMALWFWIFRVFSSEDKKLIKEILQGIRAGALIKE